MPPKKLKSIINQLLILTDVKDAGKHFACNANQIINDAIMEISLEN